MPHDVVLVTGANSGIGLGLVRALSELGRRVACLDLTGANLSGLWYLRCDVTDAAQGDASVAAVIADWGRIDILVSNACLADPSTVGRRLPGKMGSRRAVITSGPAEAIAVLVARLMPATVGRFLSARAAAARGGPARR